MTSITARGTRYDVSGPADADPVVLVHGLGLTREMWQWQLDDLQPRYRVITYDLVGHGETPPLSGAPTLTTFSDQLLDLLDHLRVGRAALVGFSLGGMIVRRFAMDHPGHTAALAILHSAHARDAAARQAVQDRVDQARREGPAATVEAALQRWFSSPFREQHPDVMAQIRASILANDREVYPGNYQVLVDGVDELVAPDPPIDCPTLVMTGDADYGNSPAMSEAIAAEIAGARLIVLDGLRHMGMAEQPQCYNRELLAFLDTVFCDRAKPDAGK